MVNHLTGIGDVWMSVDRREFATAKRLGRAFAEDLRLLEDLGWADSIDRETVALTVAPDELTRALARRHKDASGSLGTYERSRFGLATMPSCAGHESGVPDHH